MVAKLLAILEQGMQKELLNNQSSGVGGCAKQINENQIDAIGLEPPILEAQHDHEAIKNLVSSAVFRKNKLE